MRSSASSAASSVVRSATRYWPGGCRPGGAEPAHLVQLVLEAGKDGVDEVDLTALFIDHWGPTASVDDEAVCRTCVVDQHLERDCGVEADGVRLPGAAVAAPHGQGVR
jgi:hypothetical protein